MALEERMKAAVGTYISSFEKGELDSIMGIYADDCWIEDPVGTERKVGRDAVREFYRVAIDMGAKATLESEIRVAGNEAAFAFCMEFDTGDGIMAIRPIDVMVFNDEGKAISMRAFFGPSNQSIEKMPTTTG